MLYGVCQHCALQLEILDAQIDQKNQTVCLNFMTRATFTGSMKLGGTTKTRALPNMLPFSSWPSKLPYQSPFRLISSFRDAPHHSPFVIRPKYAGNSQAFRRSTNHLHDAGLNYSKFIVSSSFNSAGIRGGHKVTYSGVEFSEVSSHYAMMEQI